MTDTPHRSGHCSKSEISLLLYRGAGKPEQAQERLSTAMAMYGERGMTYWLEKLEKSVNALA